MSNRKSGVELGPSAILENNFEEEIKSLTHFQEIQIDSIDLKKNATFPFDIEALQSKYPKIRNLPQFLSEEAEIETKVGAAISDESFVLSLGGDHSIATGTISGVAKKYPDICILWVDAHPDINTLQGSQSGNIHGCPVSLLMGMSEIPSIKRVITPKQIGYLGIRSIDEDERRTLRELQIYPNAVATSLDIVKEGVEKALDRILAAIDPTNSKPIHLSFDIDALDIAEAPDTGTPVPAGLTLREGIIICENLSKTGRLVSMDVVEVNPIINNSSLSASKLKTVVAAQTLILAALGHQWI